MKNPELFDEANTATYCPEDDKLRLYVGRVPREEYDALRAEGWTSTPKQDCDFVAVWTPRREDTAESYAGIILDEDQGPEDRAADRAERFGGYLDKRLSEATGHADRYDAGPSAHGFQSKARAVRSADRHDRHAVRALSAWDKAEYWQHRTAGVISNALHRSSPGVRMGRIKTIEAELRQAEKNAAEYLTEYVAWVAVQELDDAAEAFRAAYIIANTCGHFGKYHHPREESRTAYDRSNGTSLYSLLTQSNDPVTGKEAAALYLHNRLDPRSPEYPEASRSARHIRHLQLRVAYETQMLEAQGGRAGMLEMEVGGWIGSYQIRKVNKSPATRRVVSVAVKVKGRNRWDNSGEGFHIQNLNIERLAVESYRPPTDEDKAALAATLKAEKGSSPKKKAPALINPTKEDAERLQALWNELERAGLDRWNTERFVPSVIHEMTQAEYSAASGRTYSRCETRGVCGDGVLEPPFSNMWSSHAAEAAKKRGPAVCKIRMANRDGYSQAPRVVLITDKPKKPLPVAVWEAYAPPVPSPTPANVPA